MSQSYTVVMENQTIVADATLVLLRPAAALATAGSWLTVVRVDVSQSGTSTSQQLGIILARKATAFGTYTATTPANTTIGGPASGIAGGTAGAAATAGTDATAEGAGAVTAIKSEGFNNLSGYLWVPTPLELISLLPGADAFIVKLRGTPTTLTGWNCVVTYIENA